MFSAALIAGGRSSRMGRDKCLLEVDGQLLWQRQLKLLQGLEAAEIFISCRKDQHYFHRTDAQDSDETRWMGGPSLGNEIEFVYDRYPDSGPLGGIISVMEKASSSNFILVLAVDLAEMSLEPLKYLLQRCSPHQGAVFRSEKFFEPLAAIYPKSMAHIGQEMLASGNLRMQEFVRIGIEMGLLASCPLPQQWAWNFRNLNSPSDLP